MLIEYARHLVAPIEAAGYRLLGLYVHGSGALGGFRPESSDVDVLAIVDRPRSESQALAGQGLREAASPCPGAGRWWLNRCGADAVAARALDDQRAGIRTVPMPDDARRFVAAAKQVVQPT